MGDFSSMLLIDNTVKKDPTARITVDTPYLSGEFDAQCLPDAIYDPTWQEACAVTTRAQFEKGKCTPLKVPSSKESPVVDRHLSRDVG